jgi:hypothetical protein
MIYVPEYIPLYFTVSGGSYCYVFPYKELLSVGVTGSLTGTGTG